MDGVLRTSGEIGCHSDSVRMAQMIFLSCLFILPCNTVCLEPFFSPSVQSSDHAAVVFLLLSPVGLHFSIPLIDGVCKFSRASDPGVRRRLRSNPACFSSARNGEC